ncbi:MAG: hypothetical protein AAB437_01865 [Patescibacteria group bacterium]
MQRERVLRYGNNQGILLSEKGEIRSAIPLFLSSLAQLEILILKSSGLSINEISSVLPVGSVRNKLHILYKQNGSNYNNLIKSAIDLSLLNTTAVRGIMCALQNEFGIKENLKIVDAMDEAIKRKRKIDAYTPSSLAEIRKIAFNYPIPVSINMERPVSVELA